jgi:transposase
MIARIARMDPKLLHPIQHSSEQSQRDLIQIKLRDGLVMQRVNIICSVRFTLKSLGVRLPSPGTPYFAKRARKELVDQPELLSLIEPSLRVIDELTTSIREFDVAIEKLCAEDYPETIRLRAITGVGAITALSFLLVVGDPERFAKARDVGGYLGLVPKRDQSGTIDKRLGISKAGNAYLRRLLVGSAQYILGPFGPDCDLRRQGLALVERGGDAAKKKAAVAIARKLAVLMMTLLQQQAQYEPLRQAA